MYISDPKVIIDSKRKLRELEEKISCIFSETDDYRLSTLITNEGEESDSDASDSDLELDFEEFVEEFTDSSEVFRFLACNLADEMERTSDKILQEPPKVIPTVTNMPEYQFKINIRDKLSQAEKYLVELLASECWRLYQSIVHGLQKQREISFQPGQLKSSMTVSASDEGYNTASNQRTLMAPSLIDGLPQKPIALMHNIAKYSLSVATSAPANASDRPRLPRLPPGAKLGRPFVCHICSEMQFRIDSLQEWKYVVL